MDIILSIGLVYFFVLGAFLLKRLSKISIDIPSFNTLSVYFLQPLLVLWGLTLESFDVEVVRGMIFFMGLALSVLFITTLLAKLFNFGPKDKALFTMTSVLGNTGNIGIPVGIAVFGLAALPYLTAINLVFSLFVFSLGTYSYSRGSFSVKESLINVTKMPVLHAAIVAFLIQVFDIPLSANVMQNLEMAGHAAIVMQLLIFGFYLETLTFKRSDFEWSILGSCLMGKFLIFPALSLFVIYTFKLEGLLASVLFLESMVPIAVNNLILAGTFDCKPQVVTQSVFVTSLLFIIYAPLALIVFEWVV